ncbi:MAG: cation transporter [Myxococcales bacterium]|nr:cation transporter [Myxococcales bacterium]
MSSVDRQGWTAMWISLSASLLMLGGKVTAYTLTSSAAMFSDAAESLVHGVATGLAAYALWYAAQPDDAGHPYGHGKIAYLSAGFEGALIMAAAAVTLYQSTLSWIEKPPLRNLGWGLAIGGGLGLINLALGLALVRQGRRLDSIVLVANGKHVLSDMWTSLGVVVGVAIAWLSGQRWIDPLTGILVALRIAFEGVGLLRQAYRGLMDAADPEHSKRVVASLEQAVADGKIRAFHQLRQRRVNDVIWVEVHLLVDGELTVEVAHQRATAVEQQIRSALGNLDARITSHIEPQGSHGEAHPKGHHAPDPGLDESEPNGGAAAS